MNKMAIKISIGILGIYGLAACNNGTMTNDTNNQPARAIPSKGSYGYDLDFMKQHKDSGLVELSDQGGSAKILISGAYQARVMTSTSAGDSGNSYGWINYDLISSGKKKPQFNAFGGEERFWLGPEGGQYSLYFKKGDSFNIKYWQVPAIIDTLPWKIVSSTPSKAEFSAQAALSNYAGTEFQINIDRTIELLDRKSLESKLGTTLPAGVSSVAYQTTSSVTNAGGTAWEKQKGLLSIWLLGMLNPSPQTVVIIPFSPGKDSRSLITDDYFGKVPPDRLIVKDSVLYLTCDGKHRSKIGLSPAIAKSIVASYDFEKNVLSLIYFQADKKGSYVNSKWEIQKEPFKGDAVNAYNDGPLADGTQLGPFYEIESSSPVKELKAGEAQTYSQVTCHLEGDYATLSRLAEQVLGVKLEEARVAIIR
ncbi:MAG: hypothetical protein P4L51_02905 [Puia sp.]|nr:hypothetical protein [Puia sp.]